MVITINLARELNRFWCWQWKHCTWTPDQTNESFWCHLYPSCRY